MDVDQPAAGPSTSVDAPVKSPVKLTLKLGGSASPLPSPDLAATGGGFPPPPVSSNTAAESTLPPADAIIADTAYVAPDVDLTPAYAQHDPSGKPKKKPRKKNEPGPGKAWRKGLKGYTRDEDGNERPPGDRPPARPRVTKKSGADIDSGMPSASLGGSKSLGKVGAGGNFLPPQPLELRMPPSRKWQKQPLVLNTIAGRSVQLTSWKGDAYSPYAIARAEKDAAAAQQAAQQEAQADAALASAPITPMLTQTTYAGHVPPGALIPPGADATPGYALTPGAAVPAPSPLP